MDDFPIEDLRARWARLSTNGRAYARGYMGAAMDALAAALDVAEQYEADERAKASRLRVVPASGARSPASKDKASVRLIKG
jgi:hypothetical protein